MKYIQRFSVRLVRDGRVSIDDAPIIRCPEDTVPIFQAEMADLPYEIFQIICLTTKNAVIGIFTVSVGCINAAIVRPAEVFQRAMLCNAASIILAHCHPSNNPEPSIEDQALTKTLVSAGHLLGIEVLDHLILGSNRFVSFKERGLL